jgi:hypothetical protein
LFEIDESVDVHINNDDGSSPVLRNEKGFMVADTAVVVAYGIFTSPWKSDGNHLEAESR